jgi:hypothetical protein
MMSPTVSLLIIVFVSCAFGAKNSIAITENPSAPLLSSKIENLPRGVPSNISVFYGRNVQIVAQEASETIIYQNEVYPNVILASSNYFGQEQWDTVVPGLYYSLDSGMTWKTSFFPEFESGGDKRRSRNKRFEEDPDDGSIGDPTLAWSSDGTQVYSAVLANCTGGCDMWFWKSKDYGKSWMGPVFIDNLGDADKPMIHVDVSPTSPYKDTIYIIYDLPVDGNIQISGYSRDFGETWNVQQFAGTQGIGGDISSDLKGDLYYVYPEFSNKTLNMLLSKDGGVTFENRGIIAPTNGSFQMHLPAQDQRGALIYTVVEVDNTNGQFAGSVYVLWSDTVGQDENGWDHARLYVGHSRDQGQTWSIHCPHPLNDVQKVDRFFPWLSIDPQGTGRVHVSFYDTRNFADRSGVDVYYTYSDDGGVTWIDPIRMTSMSTFNVGWDFDQMGDYEGLSVRHDRVMPVWADNRNQVGPVCVWTSILDISVLENCESFSVSFSVSPLPVKAHQPITFTAIVSGGTAPYSYEWNFSATNGIDCSTSVCSHTYTNSSINQVSLFVTDSDGGCYRGATAWVIPEN